MTNRINTVGDTARWVAQYRAIESARPDALFSDPLATVLAGEVGHGSDILPRGARNHWPTVVRTKLVDDLVMQTLSQGCDRVINLGAGLDTRPYRLSLPSDLPWFEADLAELTEFKTAALSDEQPRCRLVTEVVDVTDAPACLSFLQKATADAQSALVITEGLLPYLTAAQVRTLTETIHQAGAQWWIIDHWSPLILRAVNLTMGSELGSARWTFASSVDFYHGWTPDMAHSVFRAAARWKRSPAALRPLAYLPEKPPGRRLSASRTWSGVVRLQNTVTGRART